MEKILVLDFGGQYNQLIARRVREHNVYAEIIPYNKTTVDKIKAEQYKGIIFTGGPNSVYDTSSPHFDPEILNAGIPILGICYGCQLIAYMENGTVENAENISEYGKTLLKTSENILFDNVDAESFCWMSHRDYISKAPKGFTITAETDFCPCAAMADDKRKIYAVQFHPEVTHTQFGNTILYNFIYRICSCKGEWKSENFVSEKIAEYKKTLKGKKVLCALSGGVDSSVAAVLLHKAIGNDLTCVFVDHGLLRLNEAEMVEKTFKDKFNMNLIKVDAQEEFLKKLDGITDPEQKRKIIGEEFIRVFEKEAKKIGKVDILAQGTIYPDVIESGSGDASTIKSHHNVGGIPEVIDFDEIVEPLRYLFKDEVRKAGLALGIPEELVFRQPFPGPGLAIRTVGNITRNKLDTQRIAYSIFI